MHVLGVDRVMIAVPDIEQTADQFRELLGLEFSDLQEPTTDTEKGSQDVMNLISPSGVEIVSPRGEDNEVSRFIEQNGPGLYAISMRVADIEVAERELAEKGVEPVGGLDHEHVVERFYHPENFGGAFVILVEYDAPHPIIAAGQA
jgi:4-hydroxyphenylpyruvate dioxygenase-like putative hemolysin